MPFLTIPTEAGETIKFYMFSPVDDAKREFCLWIIVEEASGEIVRFLDLNVTEFDMRQIIHVFQAKMFLWDERPEAGGPEDLGLGKLKLLRDE